LRSPALRLTVSLALILILSMGESSILDNPSKPSPAGRIAVFKSVVAFSLVDMDESFEKVQNSNALPAMGGKASKYDNVENPKINPNEAIEKLNAAEFFKLCLLFINN
jgi:hypothetical protein